MKMSKLSDISRTLGAAFRRCASRFPVTLVFALALTLYLCHLVNLSGETDDKRLLVCLGYFLSVGTLLSLSLHLWAEEVRRRPLRVAVQAVAMVLLAADAVFLYHCATGPRLVDVIIAHGAAVLAIGLSVFFLPFFREKDDIPAWNFAQTAIGMLALVFIVGGVMSGGLCLLTFSLHQLFAVEVGYRCYLYILIWCSLLLPLLMFLGLLPQGADKHDRLPRPTAFVSGTLHYLFLPLAGLYLLVLYVYAATIVARWELPDGWVSWLVTALMAGCIAIELGLYPLRVRDRKPWDERIARWLPLLILPLLVLMTVGIGRRFLDYGITLNRLYLATLNGWFYFVCLGLIIGRARRISWIPISFSLVFLLTSALPVNYAGITRGILHDEIKEVLGDARPLSEEQYEAWLKTLPREEARTVEDKLHYLQDWFGKESIQDLVKDGVPYRRVMAEEEPDTENLHYNQVDHTTVTLPTDYNRCTLININDILHAYTPSDSLLTIPLESMADTVRIPIDTLRTLDSHPQSAPAMLRTEAGNVLMLTTFHIYLNPQETEAEARIAGYLFHPDK